MLGRSEVDRTDSPNARAVLVFLHGFCVGMLVRAYSSWGRFSNNRRIENIFNNHHPRETLDCVPGMGLAASPPHAYQTQRARTQQHWGAVACFGTAFAAVIGRACCCFRKP